MSIKSISKQRRKFLKSTTVLATITAISPYDVLSQTGEIKIGAFAAMTGAAAAQGKALTEGIQLAIKAKNASGGVNGRKITIIFGDDAGKPEEAAAVARRFATRDSVTLAIGVLVVQQAWLLLKFFEKRKFHILWSVLQHNE